MTTACRHQFLDFQRHMSSSSCFHWVQLHWGVIGRFVDIYGNDDHHCLNFFRNLCNFSLSSGCGYIMIHSAQLFVNLDALIIRVRIQAFKIFNIKHQTNQETCITNGNAYIKKLLKHRFATTSISPHNITKINDKKKQLQYNLRVNACS